MCGWQGLKTSAFTSVEEPRRGDTGRKRSYIRSTRTGFFLLFPFIPPSIPLTFFGTRYFYPHAGRISLVTALNEKGAKAGRESRTDQRGGDRLVRGRGERVSGQRLCVFGRWGSPDRSGRRPLVSLPAHEKKGGLSGELTSPAGLGKKDQVSFLFFFFTRIGGSPSDRTLCSTHAGRGERRAGCLRVRDSSRRR